MLPLGVVAGWPWKDGTPAVTRLLGCDTGPSTFTTWGEPGQIHYGLLPSSPWCPGKGISGHEAPPPAPPFGHPLWMGWGAVGGWAVMLSHQPLPLGVSVSCRSPAAQQRPPRPPLPFLASAVVGQRARAKVGQHHWSQRACPAPRPPRTALAEAEAVGSAPLGPV